MMEVVDLDIPDFLKAMRDEYEGDPQYQRVYRASLTAAFPVVAISANGGCHPRARWRRPSSSA